jgi:hypothetical protein
MAGGKRDLKFDLVEDPLTAGNLSSTFLSKVPCGFQPTSTAQYLQRSHESGDHFKLDRNLMMLYYHSEVVHTLSFAKPWTAMVNFTC